MSKTAEETRCYHNSFKFKVLNGPFVKVYSCKYPTGDMYLDLRDVMYLSCGKGSGNYRTCEHKWATHTIEMLLRYVNNRVTIKLDSEDWPAFRDHWLKWHGVTDGA